MFIEQRLSRPLSTAALIVADDHSKDERSPKCSLEATLRNLPQFTGFGRFRARRTLFRKDLKLIRRQAHVDRASGLELLIHSRRLGAQMSSVGGQMIKREVAEEEPGYELGGEFVVLAAAQW